MHTGQPNTYYVINEYISGQTVLYPNNNKYDFPALNDSKTFASIEFDAQINTE